MRLFYIHKWRKSGIVLQGSWQYGKIDDMYIMSIEYFPEFTTLVAIRANTYSDLQEKVEKADENYTYFFKALLKCLR